MNFSGWKDTTDEQLAVLAKNNEDAFYALIQRYEQKLMRYILRLIKANKQTAEDILQEVFIKTYRYLNNFDPAMKFSSWIYRIAHNEAINYWRKNQKNVDFISIDKDNGLADKLKNENSTDEDIINEEKRTKIVEAINDLPEHYRDVLILRYLEDKDYEEISDILKKPIGTVSALIHRAKDKLKKISLENKLDELI